MPSARNQEIVPTSARLVVPMGSLRFAWAGGELRGTTGSALTIEVDDRARVTCTLTGSGALAVSGTPLRIAGPGGTALELPLDAATVVGATGVGMTRAGTTGDGVGVLEKLCVGVLEKPGVGVLALALWTGANCWPGTC